jgi:N-acetylated-alpha-linked acidic dipeptidase
MLLRLANANVLPYDIGRYATDLATHVASLEDRAATGSIDADFAALHDAVDSLDAAADAYRTARGAALQSGKVLDTDAINRTLLDLEAAFLHAEGMPFGDRYKSLYASPDPFSGYASWMLPGLRYPIATNDEALLREWMPVYVRAVNDLTGRVRNLTSLLKGE